MTTRLFFRRTGNGFCAFIWVLSLLLYGCQSPAVKLSPKAALSLTELTVAAMEPPPLEVSPDLLDTRMPVYSHFDNMALSAFSQPALYRLPGGILIAGEMGASDSVEPVQSSLKPGINVAVQGKSVPMKASRDWIPTLELADLVTDILKKRGMTASVRPGVVSLEVGERPLRMSAGPWRDALNTWYAQDSTNGISSGSSKGNAILMLGITDYRIFANQTSLRVLMKIVDPTNGRVLAKTSRVAYSTENQSSNSLANGGSDFKNSIRRLGILLIEEGLHDMGLFSATALKSAEHEIDLIQHADRHRPMLLSISHLNTGARNG